MGRRSAPLLFVCRACGKNSETTNTGNRGIYCSRACRADYERKPREAAGRYRHNGYWMLRWNSGVGDGTYLHQFEHRKVWEDAYGAIPDGYDIHHVNEDKGDNRLENLQLMRSGDHRRLHKSKWASREERLADEARRARARRAAKRKMAG